MGFRASVAFVLLELVRAEPGAWCPHCLLPSAFTLTLASQTDGGPLRLSTGVRCADCGRWTD